MNGTQTRRLAVCFLASLSAVSLARAELLAYEGFDYRPGWALDEGIKVFDGANGGIGFSGSWKQGGALEISAKSLGNKAFPAGMATGGAVFSDDQFAYATRFLTDRKVYDLDADGNTFYFSCLLTKMTANPEIKAGESADVSLCAGNKKVITIANNSQEQLVVNGVPMMTNVAAKQVCFVVIKVVTSGSGKDTIYVKAYSDADAAPDAAEPANWTKTIQQELKGKLNNLQLFNGDATGAGYDEFRIGTTWADVVTPAK